MATTQIVVKTHDEISTITAMIRHPLSKFFYEVGFENMEEIEELIETIHKEFRHSPEYLVVAMLDTIYQFYVEFQKYDFIFFVIPRGDGYEELILTLINQKKIVREVSHHIMHYGKSYAPLHYPKRENHYDIHFFNSRREEFYRTAAEHYLKGNSLIIALPKLEDPLRKKSWWNWWF